MDGWDEGLSEDASLLRGKGAGTCGDYLSGSGGLAWRMDIWIPCRCPVKMSV